MTIKRQLERLQKSFQDAKEETGHRGPSSCCHDVYVERTINLVEWVDVPTGKKEKTVDPDGIEDEGTATKRERRYCKVVAKVLCCGHCLKPTHHLRIEAPYARYFSMVLWTQIRKSGNYFVEFVGDGNTLVEFDWKQDTFLRRSSVVHFDKLAEAATPEQPDFKARASGEEQEPLPYEPGCDEGMM